MRLSSPHSRTPARRPSRLLRDAALAIVLWLAFLAAPTAARAQLTAQTMNFDGKTRTWYVHVPASYDGTQPVPLVLVLHGLFSTGDQFAPISEWTPVSDQQGFIVVYPNGGLYYNPTSLGWNDFVYAGEKPDDVGFLFTLIQTLKTQYKVDPDRVYMTGFSNGASMTNTFCGNGHTSLLAAIAPCSGDWMTTYGIPESIQHPAGTVSTWIMRGSLEDFTEGNQTHAVQDANQTAYWVGIDGCNPTPQTITDGIYNTSIYTGGKGEVRYSLVSGYNHQYGPGYAAKIWSDFFSRIVRPPPAPGSVPSVSVTAPAPRAGAQSGKEGTFEFHLTGTVVENVRVQFKLSGDATNGLDYALLPDSHLVWASKGYSRLHVVPTAPHPGESLTEEIRLELLPGFGYTVGEPSAARVTISIND